jgi:hypothetical protein
VLFISLIDQRQVLPKITSQFLLPAEPQIGYLYSLLDSVSITNDLFSALRGDDRRKTECFNRAHGWSYDLDQQFHIKNFKVFIFYTKRFRKEVDRKWDFHVAPLVTTTSGDIVLDKTFVERPLPLTDWVSYFSKQTLRIYQHIPRWLRFR